MTPGRRVTYWSWIAAIIILAVSSAILRLSLVREQRSAADAVGNEAKVAAMIVSMSITSAQQQLQGLASGQVFANADVSGISEAIQRFNPESHGFTGTVAWIDTDGTIQVSSEGGVNVAHTNIGDRQYVRDSLSGKFSASDVLIGRVQDRPVIVFSVPTLDPEGVINGVLAGTSRLDKTDPSVVDLFGDANVDLLDSNAMLIAGSHDFPMGQSFLDTSLWPKLNTSESGVLKGVEGLRGDAHQIVGFATIQSTDWHVVAQRPRSDVYAAAARHFRVAVGSISTVVIVGLLGAAFLGRQIDKAHRKLVDSEQLLRGTLAELPVGVVLVDTHNGKIIQRNRRFDELFSGYELRVVEDSYSVKATHFDNRPYETHEWPLHRAIRGETVDSEEAFFVQDSGHNNVYRVSAAPIRDEHGKIRRAISVYEDITERFWTAVREHQVTEAVAAMSSSRNTQEICRLATDRAVTAFAARAGAVLLVDTEIEDQLRGCSSIGYPDDFEQLKPLVSMKSLVPDSALHIVSNETEHKLRNESPSLFDTRDGSWIAAPLLSGGRKIGALWLAFEDSVAAEPKISSRVQAFAAQLGQALDVATQSELEHDFVVTLQRSLLGHIPAHLDGLSLDARYLPASDRLNLGGDWYDVIRLAESRIALVIGDVVGPRRSGRRDDGSTS